MNEFIVINVMNEAMIKTLQDQNKNCDDNFKIKELLKDEAIFFKISKKNAFEVLKRVGVQEEQFETVYKKLTDRKIFYDLLNKGKIKANDEHLVVKYDIMDYNNIFKNNNE